MLHWESTSAHVNVTWHRNDSAAAVPGEEESRVWVQDGALWIVPASRADSGSYICTTRSAPWGQEEGRGLSHSRCLRGISRTTWASKCSLHVGTHFTSASLFPKCLLAVSLSLDVLTVPALPFTEVFV